MVIENVNNVKVQEAVYFCVLEDLRAAFRDNTVFTVRINGGDTPATEKLFRRMLAIGQKGPFLEVILKRRSWVGNYQIVVEEGCVSIYNDVSNYAYHVGTERYEADDPALSDISTRIRYTIMRDAMCHLARIGQTNPTKKIASQLDHENTLTKGSFLFRKDEIRDSYDEEYASVTEGRLQLTVKKVITSIAMENPFDPIILANLYQGDLVFDGEANVANGVFALRSGSKMMQTGLVYFGLLRDLQIEDPGIYEIVVHVFASRPTWRINKSLDGTHQKHSG